MSKRLKYSMIFIFILIIVASAFLGYRETIKTLNKYQTVSISRSKIFDSLEDMSNRADAIVIGTTANSEPVFDIDPEVRFDATDMNVSEVLKGSISPGDTIIVRQTYLSDDLLMQNNTTYLLFLNTTKLGGELADQFYITGVTAGIYELSTSNARSATPTFKRFDKESGDDLPKTVDEADVEESLEN